MAGSRSGGMRIRLPIDGYSAALLGAVLLAAILPARGVFATATQAATAVAVAMLFFLHGARLSRAAVVAGAAHWKLQLLVLLATFGLFPLFGLAMQPLMQPLLGPLFAAGLLYLTLLPSTVQSSIAFTSIAGGNVPAAVCSAAASNLIGTLLTPVLVAIFMGMDAHGGDTGAVVRSIVLQLLLPFAAGQAVQPLIGGWIDRHRELVSMSDRGSILLVVYAAFSAAMIEGLFARTSIGQIVGIGLVSAILLGTVMLVLHAASRRLGFSREDRIAILFCGSKKSLASGVPMAGVLFSASTVGTVILPLMVFHQLQLLVCAYLAQVFARRQDG